jgi:hypothetical protein
MRIRQVSKLLPYTLLLVIVLAPAASLAASHARLAPAARNLAGPRDYYPMSGYVFSGGSDYYFYNSAGENTSIANPLFGTYEVTFDGLGPVAGSAIVEVTQAVSPGTCAIDFWDLSGSVGLQADVSCFGFSGTVQSALFDLAVTRPTAPPHGVFDYAFMYAPTGNHVLAGFQYNSAGKKNSVRHLGTGRYQITFGGPRSKGVQGAVKVTPYGNSAGDCITAGWHGSNAGEIVDVDCYGTAGSPQNREFTVVYASATNILGLSNVAGANAYANRPATHSYQPSVQYDSEHGARVTVQHIGKGQYSVTFKGSEGSSANGGDVQVTAVSSADRHCFVLGWEQKHDPDAEIQCKSNTGANTDTSFVVTWVVG